VRSGLSICGEDPTATTPEMEFMAEPELGWMDIKLSHLLRIAVTRQESKPLRRSEPGSGGENLQIPSQLSKAYDAAGAGVPKVSWNAKEPAP